MSYQINNDSKLLKLEKLSKVIAEKMGLSFSNKQLMDLNRDIDLAAKEAGFLDVETYIDFLLSTELTHKDILDLAEKVTVGETYFFREKKALDILEKEILPKITKQKHHAKKQLKIWSVGCSTGEEPYTLAMILKKVLHNFDNWDITIFASDINLSSLKKALAGVYNSWSFRAIELTDKKTFFNELAENQFEIVSELKKIVKFEYLNLAYAIYPAHFNIANSFDLILCRNVMIYLTLECQTKIIQHFYRVLKPNGWLIVSPTETRLLNKSQFTAVHFPETILHQKAVKKLEVVDLDKLEKENLFELELDIEKSDQVSLDEEI
ncbi:MAG: protein-glutamate O-methyltransferase CheR, partial [Blastocatellia bacterium]